MTPQQDVFEMVTVYRAPYSKVEELIKSYFQIKEFEIPEVEECGNDTSLEYELNGKVSEYLQKKVNKVREGGYEGWVTQAMLNTMVAEGVLAPGKYIIRVSW